MSTAIYYRGFNAPAIDIVSIVVAFLIICSGVVLLQVSRSSNDSLSVGPANQDDQLAYAGPLEMRSNPINAIKRASQLIAGARWRQSAVRPSNNSFVVNSRASQASWEEDSMTEMPKWTRIMPPNTANAICVDINTVRPAHIPHNATVSRGSKETSRTDSTYFASSNLHEASYNGGYLFNDSLSTDDTSVATHYLMG